MSIFTKIGAWFAGIFKSVKNNAVHIAVAATEAVQSALKAGVLQPIVDLLDNEFHTHLGDESLALIDANINKILALELGLEGLPDNPTADQLKAFSDSVISSFAPLDVQAKSKLYTLLAVQVYNIFSTDKERSFASIVKDIEEAYADYKADLAAQEQELSQTKNDADGTDDSGEIPSQPPPVTP